MGGKPFPDGDEPEDRSRGDANDEFASVVFDEEFVRAAAIHEPTAIERMLAAAEARADAEASRRRRAGVPEDDPYEDGYGPDGEAGYAPDGDRYQEDGFGHDPDADGDYSPYGRYGDAGRPYRSHVRWHRPVAWLLAVLMGVGVVSLAFTAVYRGASGSRQDPAPPHTTSGVGNTPSDRHSGLPSVSADSGAPPASAAPRSP